MLITKILLFLLLLTMVFQDFRYKAISWILFPIGLIVSVIISLHEITIGEMLYNVLVNLVFIAFQLGVIFLYAKIKFKNKVSIFSNVFGLGDLLFLIMICVLFSPFNFVLFYIFSLAFSLLIYLVMKHAKLYKDTKIPLAGLQSVFLIITFYLNYLEVFSFYNDFQIFEILIG